mmetsp:Transcript_102017/g.243253  ORF Transcript_102017/g.243253 Transcript_102017/m.243253 type:complete len:222 (+) Transcript_102017:36-701(+)
MLELVNTVSSVRMQSCVGQSSYNTERPSLARLNWNRWQVRSQKLLLPFNQWGLSARCTRRMKALTGLSLHNVHVSSSADGGSVPTQLRLSSSAALGRSPLSTHKLSFTISRHSLLKVAHPGASHWTGCEITASMKEFLDEYLDSRRGRSPRSIKCKHRPQLQTSAGSAWLLPARTSGEANSAVNVMLKAPPSSREWAALKSASQRLLKSSETRMFSGFTSR